jgi:hypothetical protein
MDDERTPDHTDDPREQGTGQGYPESNPAEATPREGTDEGPEAGTGQSGPPSTEREKDRGQTTGNPDAAG